MGGELHPDMGDSEPPASEWATQQVSHILFWFVMGVKIPGSIRTHLRDTWVEQKGLLVVGKV
jgi:hypothetical protein